MYPFFSFFFGIVPKRGTRFNLLDSLYTAVRNRRLGQTIVNTRDTPIAYTAISEFLFIDCFILYFRVDLFDVRPQ